MKLEHKVALVTGGARRIGRALALGLAARGVDVAVHYHRSEQEAHTCLAEIEALGRRAVALQGDLADPDVPARLIQDACQALGGVEILINSAARFEWGPLDAATPESLARQMAVNAAAPLLLCQHYARQLAPDQRGHILNLIDWRAERPGVMYVAYTMSKAALLALTRSLALALAPQVQVNAIAPGHVLAPDGDEGAYEARVRERIPLARIGTPDEVVKAALYALQSDFLTGEVIHVTGGEHL